MKRLKRRRRKLKLPLLWLESLSAGAGCLLETLWMFYTKYFISITEEPEPEMQRWTVRGFNHQANFCLVCNISNLHGVNNVKSLIGYFAYESRKFSCRCKKSVVYLSLFFSSEGLSTSVTGEDAQLPIAPCIFCFSFFTFLRYSFVCVNVLGKKTWTVDVVTQFQLQGTERSFHVGLILVTL